MSTLFLFLVLLSSLLSCLTQDSSIVPYTVQCNIYFGSICLVDFFILGLLVLFAFKFCKQCFSKSIQNIRYSVGCSVSVMNL